MQRKDKYLNYGLLVAALLPQAVSLWLCIGSLHTIWSELTTHQAAAMSLGLGLLTIPCLLAAIVATLSLRRAVPVGAKKIAALILSLIAAFYCFFNFVEPHVFLRDWLFDHDTYLTVIISGLIPLFYYLLFYLAARLEIASQRSLIVSIVAAVLLPVGAYLGVHILRFLPNLSASRHLWQIGAVTLTSAFSFFILRLLVYMLARKADALQKPGTIWTLQLIFVTLLPLLGLALNSWGPVARESQSVIGNFTARSFWLLSLVNGILCLLPTPRYYPAAVILLLLRTAGYTFVLYFCVVFILFLPLALILIAAIGLGLLLLIPYFAAAAQFLKIRQNFTQLDAAGHKTLAVAAIAAGAVLLPAIVTGSIYRDHLLLRSAIRFLEQPPLELNQKSGIDSARILELAAMEIPRQNQGRSFRHDARDIPLYDALYRQIVFEGADLSETLRKRIRYVFGGVDEFQRQRQSLLPPARLENIRISSKEEGGLTQSTLRVMISNDSNRTDAEFTAGIELGNGSFITGHWLTIDGVEVPAQITNRNTAIWVYNRVTEMRRDPSLIYYEGRDRLRWRVFPVPPAGRREARLVITHPQDTTVRIAGRNFELKGASNGVPLAAEKGAAQLVAPTTPEKAETRKPYLHFIADCGVHAKADYRADADRAADYLGLTGDGAQISFVNTSIITTELGAGSAVCPGKRGGFFADMAIKAVLHSQFRNPSSRYPVVVVLSPERLVSDTGDVSHITAFYGDADGILHFNGKTFQTHQLADGSVRPGKPRLNQPVVFYGGRYFAADQRVVFPEGLPAAIPTSPLLDGISRFYEFYLGKNDYRGLAVLSAIETGVLNPAAGSIVLETEAQRRRLTELHRRLLTARNQLDIGNEPRMSEPLLFFIAAGIFFMVLGYLRWRRDRAAHAKIAWFDEEN